MKLDKNELNGHWFEANEETFIALVGAGYVPAGRETCKLANPILAIERKENTLYNIHKKTLIDEKQAYYHSGEFFTRNDKGEIRGLWVTDVPLEEQAYIDACDIVGDQRSVSMCDGQNVRDFVASGNNYLWEEGRFYPDMFCWANPKGHKIPWQDFVRIFGTKEHQDRWLNGMCEDGYTEVMRIPITEEQEKKIIIGDAELTYEEQQQAKDADKAPFPEMDEIEWVTVEAPEWFSPALLMSQYGKFTYPEPSKAAFEAVKSIYKNSKDFTVTWELKEKHTITCDECGTTWEGETASSSKLTVGVYCSPKCADRADLKAEYTAAKEAEKNGGPIVKRFWRRNNKEWKEVPSRDSSIWFDGNEYRLRYYRINWNKVPRFIDVEVSDCEDFRESCTYRRGFICKTNANFFAYDVPDCIDAWKHCRLAPGVEIQDEWLEEVTDEAEMKEEEEG